MNLKDRILKKSNLWHAGAVLLFVIISCVYFAPALKGYSVKQGDIVNFIGMSREVADFRDNNGEQIQWTNAMFSGMPTTQISTIYEGTWLSRGLTKLVHLGLPAPIYYLFVYLFSFYVLAMSLRFKPLVGIIGSVAFGLSSYFIVILEAGHNSKAAAIGLAPLMIAGFIMAYRFKNWILGVALASIFMMIELAANHVQITYYMAFVMLLLGVVELVKHVKEKQLPRFVKVTGALLGGYVLAVLVNYGNLFGTIDYAKQTIRGGSELTITPDGLPNEDNTVDGLDPSYITNWSYGHGETFTLFVPNFKGGETQQIGGNERNEEILDDLKDEVGQMAGQVAQQNQYWGNQPFTSGPVYIGIIVMLLAFLALVYSKEKYKWALLSVTLLTIALSWGSNYVSALILLPILLYNVNIFLDEKKQLIFSGVNTLFFLVCLSLTSMGPSLTDFFLDYVPGYNKFRAVTIILVVVELCAPLLAILFLHRLFKAREEIKKNSFGFYIVSALFLLFLLINLIAPNTFNSFLSIQEEGMIEGITDPNMLESYLGFFGALEDARIAIFKMDVLRSLAFLLVGVGVIYAYIRIGFSKIFVGATLIVFILIDLVMVDQRYLNNDGRGKNYNQWVEKYEMTYPFAAGEGEKSILAMEINKNPAIKVAIDSALNVLEQEFKGNKDISAREKLVRRDFVTYRVLNRMTNFRVYEEGNPFNSSYTSYFNKSIGGYHGAKLSRYQDLIDFHISRGNPAVINMLNTRYYIRPERDAAGQRTTKLSQTNSGAMGNAWFSKNIQIVADADEEIMSMGSYNATKITNVGEGKLFVNGNEVQGGELRGREEVSIQMIGMEAPMPVPNMPYGALQVEALAFIADSTSKGGFNWVYNSAPDSLFDKIFVIESQGVGGWDPAKTTLVDQRYKENVSSESYSGNGAIKMVSYGPDVMIYESSSLEKQLAVFSEIYYEGGWTAYVDNEETPISRVNYALRAIEVPAGTHEIRFEFKSETFESSRTYATIGTVLLLILLAAGIYLEYKGGEDDIVLDTNESNEEPAK